MLMNTAKCTALTPEYVNTKSGLELHRFHWLDSEDLISAIPHKWNHLSTTTQNCPKVNWVYCTTLKAGRTLRITKTADTPILGDANTKECSRLRSHKMAEDFITQAKSVLQTEIDGVNLSRRIGPEFTNAVNSLREGLTKRGKIIVIGVGKSENIATKIAATLNSTGATAVVLNCQNALHGDLGIMAEGDTVLALSYSGQTPELLNLLPHLKRRAAAIIAFTGKTNSLLATNSDIVLDVGVETEACPMNLAPTSSSTNMLALGDALAMVLLQARGFQPKDFAELHPSGGLGRNNCSHVSPT